MARVRLLSLLLLLTLLTACDSANHHEATEGLETFSGEEIFRGIFLGQGKVASLFPEFYGEAFEESLKEIDLFEELTNEELTELAKLDLTQDDIKAMIAAVFADDGHNNTGQEFHEYIVEYRENVNSLIAYIDKEQPTFFGEFALEMQSGNHVKVKSALRKASEIYLIALENVLDIDLEGYLAIFGDQLDVSGAGKCVAFAAITVGLTFMAVNIAVGVTWATAVNAVLVYTEFALWDNDPQGFGSGKLSRDYQIDLVTMRLRLS